MSPSPSRLCVALVLLPALGCGGAPSATPTLNVDPIFATVCHTGSLVPAPGLRAGAGNRSRSGGAGEPPVVSANSVDPTDPGRIGRTRERAREADPTEEVALLALETGPERPLELVGPQVEEWGGLPLEEEVRGRICGTPVEMRGSAGRIVLRSFELHTIAGDTAFVGVLLGSGSEPRLHPLAPATGEVARPIRGDPVTISELHGHTVWVSGRLEGELLILRRVGRLRPGARESPPDPGP